MCWRVLAVEDDSIILKGISKYFSERGMVMSTCGTEEEAYELIDSQTFDLAILDIMLGEGVEHINDGFNICQWIHQETPELPVIILSGRVDNLSVEQGYDLGCHEYVPKPCSPPLLFRKAKAMIQLAKARETDGTKLCIHGVSIDLKSRRCSIGGTDVHLSKMQFDLLHYLMINAGTALTYEQLLAHVWDQSSTNEDPRTVRNHVSRLKKALGEKGDCIEAVVGVGYRFREEGE